jgi:sulfatase modifying factor 1
MRVQLSPFSISRFAVRNAQVAAFVRATGYRTEAERFGWSFVFAPFLPEDSPVPVRWSLRLGGAR